MNINMEYFYEKLETTDIPPISTVDELYYYLKIANGDCSDETIRPKINIFKDVMGYSYARHLNNPLLIEQNYSNISFTHELSCIHQRMFYFLSQNNYMTLKPNYKHTRIDWHLPALFRPIIVAYILALSPMGKKNTSASQLFEDINKCIQSTDLKQLAKTYNFKSEDHLRQHYNVWLEATLYKNYFLLLEEKLNILSNNQEQRSILYESTNMFTEVLMSPLYFHTDSIHWMLTTLLSHYFEQCSSASTDKLFTKLVPLKIDANQKFVNALYNDLANLLGCLYDFTETYIKNNIKFGDYPLSITNYRDFCQKYDRYCKSLLTKESFLSSTLQGYFVQIMPQTTSIRQLIQENRIIPDQAACEKQMDCLYTIFSKSYKEAINECKKFTNKVKKASEKDSPSDVSSTLLNIDHTILKDNIDQILTNTKRRLQKDFSELPPIYLTKEIGLIEKYRYPNFPYNKNTLSSILHILYPEITETQIIEIILEALNQDIPIPCDSRNFLSFLTITNNIMKNAT